MRLASSTSLTFALLAALAAGAGCDPHETPANDEVDAGERGPGGKADAQQVPGSCIKGEKLLCGGQGHGGCWCDELCASYGDCCADFAPVCEPEPEPDPEPETLCKPEILEVNDLVISEDTVWDHCEVHLMREKTIVDGALTIMPGVHVFGQNAATPSSLLIRGSLTAHGTEDQPIVFQPGEERASWGGLRTGAYTDHVSLEYVELVEPVTGIKVSGGSVTAHHVVMRGYGNGTGLAVSPTRPEVTVELDDVLIRDFGTGISGWRIGHLHGAGSRVTVRNAIIEDNARGIFLGTDYEYCGNPEVKKPHGYLTVEHSNIVDNGLAFGVGYDERWTRYQIERSNLVDNGDIALIQPYEVPAASWIRDSNIVGNEGGLEAWGKISTASFPHNHWGELSKADILARSSGSCSSAALEDRFSFGELRAEPIADAGPQPAEPWAAVCEHAGSC